LLVSNVRNKRDAAWTRNSNFATTRTFSATKATAFYRIHKPHELVLMVLTLLAHGSALFKRSWPLLASTSALWPAGKERPERTAKGRMSTS
jgi:hypothetical protein